MPITRGYHHTRVVSFVLASLTLLHCWDLSTPSMNALHVSVTKMDTAAFLVSHSSSGFGQGEWQNHLTEGYGTGG